MPASGSSIFTDTEGYQASLQEMLDLLAFHPRDFQARLTWVELANLCLLRAQETSPRIAYMTLPPELIFITFPTQKGAPLIYCGAELQFGDVVFHGRGERGHQRTTANGRWGSISITHAALKAFGRVIADQDLSPPQAGKILRPPAADWQRFLRLHAQAGRIAETGLHRISHEEIARALEQDLIWALITCLATAGKHPDRAIGWDKAGISVRLEAVLAAHPYRVLSIREICRCLEVSQRALNASCQQVLGISPGRYQRLRRLKLVLAEFMRARSGVSIAEVMQRYGFSDRDHFVAEYRDAYGEMPPASFAGWM